MATTAFVPALILVAFGLLVGFRALGKSTGGSVAEAGISFQLGIAAPLLWVTFVSADLPVWVLGVTVGFFVYSAMLLRRGRKNLQGS